MLKITIEVIPFGKYEDRYPIHSIYIANVSGSTAKADYDAWIGLDPTDYDKDKRPKPHVQIKRYKRHLGAIELLRQTLNKWYTKESKEKDHVDSRST
jgi:hypothetical protein